MSSHREGELTGERILCVEDDEDTCEALAELLRLPGYQVVTAYTVAQGLYLAQARDFDLIILDNWFKVSSGVELCRQIRGFDSETPILFYSAAAYDTDIEAGLRVGADAYIVKPNFEEFRQAVTQMLSSGRKGKP